MLPLERPVIGFTIPGKPFGKQRPRFSRATGRTFTPAETVAFERTVAEIGLLHFPKPFDGPVRLTVVATFIPAESWSQKKPLRTSANPTHRSQTLTISGRQLPTASIGLPGLTTARFRKC